MVKGRFTRNAGDPVELEPAVRTRLEAYCDLILNHSSRLDLVSDADLDRLWERHVLDSLKGLGPLDALDDVLAALPCVDVGSGAGVPGVPLAIARPGRRWHLLEPRARRAAFLEEAVRVLELDCEVLVMRAEQAGADPLLRAGHALAAGRALAAPKRAFALLTPLVAPSGIALLWTGSQSELPPEAEDLGSGLAIIRAEKDT